MMISFFKYTAKYTATRSMLPLLLTQKAGVTRPWFYTRWLEGRRTLIPTTEGSTAVGDFSDVQPSGSKIVSQSNGQVMHLMC
jgi:hypothetical protein